MQQEEKAIDVLHKINNIDNIDNIDSIRHNNYTLLQLSCMYKLPKLILELLDKKSNIHIADNNGNTPLHLACKISFSEEIYMKFIKQGAEINKLNIYGQSPIFEAFVKNNNNENAIKILIKSNCKLNITNVIRHTPMHCICAYSNPDIIILAYNKGGNIFNKDKYGEMPLDYIYKRNLVQVIDYIKNKLIYHLDSYTKKDILLDKNLIKCIVNFIY